MPSPLQRIRVLIADDNRIVRRGLRLLLDNAPDIRVVGEVDNGIDAVAVARNERVDIVLMDLQMPGMTGAEATREILRTAPASTIAIIVMTSFAIDGYVADALDAGVVGYLLKGLDTDHLLDAIHAAARAEAIVSPRVTAPVLREFVRRGIRHDSPELVARLTAAEHRVVATLSSGITSNEDIAEHLGVSVHTVRSQLHSALKKTGLDDRTQLALWGVRNQLDVAVPSSD